MTRTRTFSNSPRVLLILVESRLTRLFLTRTFFKTPWRFELSGDYCIFYDNDDHFKQLAEILDQLMLLDNYLDELSDDDNDKPQGTRNQADIYESHRGTEGSYLMKSEKRMTSV